MLRRNTSSCSCDPDCHKEDRRGCGWSHDETEFLLFSIGIEDIPKWIPGELCAEFGRAFPHDLSLLFVSALSVFYPVRLLAEAQTRLTYMSSSRRVAPRVYPHG